MDVVRPFIAGAVAGMTATSIIQPIDFVKTRLQLAGEGVRGGSTTPLVIIRSTLATSGPSGFYAGLSAALLRQFVYGSARLGLFRVVSDYFKKSGGESLSFAAKLGIGLTTGGAAAVLGNPADLALVRMQADSSLPADQRRNYRGVVDALRRIIHEEGARMLWRGSAPTIGRAATLNMAMLATSDQLKESMGPHFVGGEKSIPVLLISSTLAGIAGAVASLPFDMLKTRLQKQRPGPDGVLPYTGLLDAARKIWSREGPLAFYRGIGTYCARIGPHAFFTLITLDWVTGVLSRSEVRLHHAASTVV